ncbi:MAG: FliH/SctL family protein [Acidimicrobiales bacterium]
MTSSAEPTITYDGPVVRGSAASGMLPADLFTRFDADVEPTGLWAARAEAAREESRRVGYADGFAEGRVAGHDVGYHEGRAECAPAVAALEQLIDSLRDADRHIGEEIGEETSDFALAAVEAILARELAVADDPGLEAIARCLAIGPELGDIEARLHPEDIKTLGHVERVTGDRRFEITPDASLQRGDAVVTIGDTTVDGRLAEALDRLRDALR